MAASEPESYSDGYVLFPGATCVASTKLAVRVRWDDEEDWFPSSCVHEDSEVYKNGTEGKFIVRERIATEKGWL